MGGLAAFLLPALVEGGSQLGVTVNEIQYAPSSGSPDPALRFEHVELYNSTATPLDLSGYTLRDVNAAGVQETLFTLPALALPAYSFLVVYAAAATGTLVEDTDLDDGAGLLIAAAWTGTAGLANAGDAVELYDATNTIQDFVYYDEANAGDAAVDDDAVANGIWKDGAAIDTLSSAVTGRAIALRVDGAAPHEVDPAPDAEDLDWMQYDAVTGGTPGRWNDPATVFLDGFESGGPGHWSLTSP